MRLAYKTCFAILLALQICETFFSTNSQNRPKMGFGHLQGLEGYPLAASPCPERQSGMISVTGRWGLAWSSADPSGLKYLKDK